MFSNFETYYINLNVNYKSIVYHLCNKVVKDNVLIFHWFASSEKNYIGKAYSSVPFSCLCCIISLLSINLTLFVSKHFLLIPLFSLLLSLLPFSHPHQVQINK